MNDVRECLEALEPQQWIMAEEQGKNGHRHWQCGALFGAAKRPDNVKRAMKAHLTGIPEQEWKQVKVKNHSDWKGLVGYCVKEQDLEALETADNVWYEMEPDFIRECHAYYLQVKAEAGESMPKKSDIQKVYEAAVESGRRYMAGNPTFARVTDVWLTLFQSEVVRWIKAETWQNIRWNRLIEFVNATLTYNLETAGLSKIHNMSAERGEKVGGEEEE